MIFFLSGIRRLIVSVIVCCIIFSCKEFTAPLTKEFSKLIHIPEIHNNKVAYSIDSLIFIGQPDKAIAFSLLVKDTLSPKLHGYMNAKILEAYTMIGIENHDLFELVKTTGSEIKEVDFMIKYALAIYRHRFIPLECDLAQINELLDKAPGLYHRTMIMNLKGAYFKEISLNLDSAWYWYEAAVGVLKSFPYQTMAHAECYHKLSTLCTYKRKNLLAIKYANQMADFKSYFFAPDSLLLNQAYTNRAFMLFREGDFNGSYEDGALAMKYSDSIKYPAHFQEMLKSLLLVSMVEGNDTLFHQFYNRLNSFIEKTGRDHINIFRIRGLYLYNQDKFSEAVPHLNAAVEYELDSGYDNYAVYSNLCHYLSECYRQIGHYESALDAMMLNSKLGKHFNYELFKRNILNEKLYSFVGAIQSAEILFTSYESSGSKNDLYRCHELLTLVDSLMFGQLKVSEENAILQFYTESGGDFFRLGTESSYALWKLTGKDEYVEDFFRFCEKSKNSLLLRDYLLGQQYKNIPDSIFIKERKLKAEIKAAQVKGLRDNERFNELAEAYQKMESVLEKFYPDFFNNPLLMNMPDLKRMKHAIPDDNTTILHIKENQGAWYFGLLSKQHQYVSKVKYEGPLLEAMDSLLTICRDDILISPDNYEELGLWIFENLFDAKIRSNLGNKIIIIPDGYFYRFPLSALVERSGRGLKNMDSLNYFYKSHFISYAPSVQMLESLKETISDSKHKVAIFAFSDKETIKSQTRTALSELPGTYYEAIKLSDRYPDAKIFSGKKATKENFLRVYTDSTYAYIHLALHGIANSGKRDDVKLYFRTEEGGLDSLYGYELLEIRSKVKKVVLTACQSGIGKYEKGEGSYSLPRYFMINGALDVTASLWDLNDNFNPERPNVALVRYIR